MSDDPQQRSYPEDERLRRLQEDPDRRMTRKEWERDESHARQAAHTRHSLEDQKSKPDHEKQDPRRDTDAAAKKRQKAVSHKKILLWAILGAVVLLLIFFIGFIPRHQHERKAEQAARDRETEAPEVEVAQVKRAAKTGELTIPGTTTPLTQAYIYARANGYVKKRYVDIGDHVKKGQLLALIDAPDLDQQVDQARQQLNQAEAQLDQQRSQLALNRVTWDRWRVLVAKGVFSRQDGDQREADYTSQLAVVASAERNVESYRANLRRVLALQSYERVTAPFDGVITDRNVDVGALVGATGAGGTPPMQSPQTSTGGSGNVGSTNTSGSSGTANQSASPSTGGAQGGALFGIAQFDKLRILVSVPEGYATSVHRGMQALVYVQERTGKPISGVVTRTADSIDQNSRTMLVEVDLDNKNGNLYPGMYSIVTFVQVHGVAPITIPGDAVIVRNDRNSVAVVRDNRIRMVPVQIGRDYGPSVEILSGLQEGDWIVTTVTDSVKAGIPVRSKQNDQAAQDSSGQGGAQPNQVPNAGPDQYGDESIVDSKSESTNTKSKPGTKSGGSDKSEGKSGEQKSGGKQPKQSDKKDSQ